MTPDERNMLLNFLQDIDSTRGAAKDPEADAMIHQALAANPDAPYLLVLHAIIADQALHAAQAQIAQLQSQLNAQPAAPTSFLSTGAVPAVQAPAYPPQAYTQPQYQEPAYAPPPQPTSPFGANSGLGGFLRTAGTMAAGVAGGEFLAQGLSNLFSPRDW
jgi:hypothetical protein